MLGEVINNYEIKALLGEGGMGAVYLAEHPFIGRRAAIKILRRDLAQDAAMVERFMNEARAANAIRHPNIIDIIDVGRASSGVPYLMMEFLDGMTLSQRIAQVGKLGLGEALEIAQQTAGALGAAHGKGIVHRDLKPDNLFLLADDSVAGGARVKVLDFGIAKLRGDLTNLSARTQAGALMGTPPYMSPEQCRGLVDEVDHRTDVYALGVILYEMLCGAPPFVSEGWGEIVMAHMTAQPPPPRARNPEITAAVEAIIYRALAKERSTRFATMAELQAALRAESPFPHVGGTAPRLESHPIGVGGTAVQHIDAQPARSPVMSPVASSGARWSPGPTTTFRNAAAEATPAAGVTTKPRHVGLIAGGVAALAIIVAVAARALVTGHAAPESTAGPAVVVHDQAAPTEAPPPPPSNLAAVTAEAPAPAELLRLHLGSEPSGASVVDTRTGAVLGATPIDRRISRDGEPLSLRIGKPGFANTEVTVPRDGDFTTTVRLERERSHAAVASPASRTAARPASKAAPATARKTSAATPAAAVVPAPAPASPPPSPVVRRPEKW